MFKLYTALIGKIQMEKPPVELTDSHFRLGYEGSTPDYDLLFLHFMFSKELFETYFDVEKQTQFRKLMADGDSLTALQLLDKELNKAAMDKDVPVGMAVNQALEWVHTYIKKI